MFPITTDCEILIAARKLIEKPENWCQGEYKSSSGSFCMAGALRHVANIHSWIRLYHLLGEFTGEESGVGFNDHHTHEEVLSVFDQAIEKLEKEML